MKPSEKLRQADKDELQKCKDSPVYFFNKYVRKEGQEELTEETYKMYAKEAERQRNIPLKLRKKYREYPLSLSECFKNLPKFLLITNESNQ